MPSGDSLLFNRSSFMFIRKSNLVLLYSREDYPASPIDDSIIMSQRYEGDDTSDNNFIILIVVPAVFRRPRAQYRYRYHVPRTGVRGVFYRS